MTIKSLLSAALVTCLVQFTQARTPVVEASGESEEIVAGWAGLPQVLKHIKAPEFADREFLITDYGAIEGGEVKCTDAIARAIEACSDAGGGKVVIPAGEWLSGPIHYKSKVCIEIQKGATLNFSTDFEDYLPAVFIRWEGIESYSYSPLIYANGCKDIGLIGEGTINGNGPAWWKWREQKPAPGPYRIANAAHIEWGKHNTPVEKRVLDRTDFHWCPTLVGFYNNENILIEGLTMIDGPFWNIHPVYCKNITIRGVTLDNDGPNGDGCNPSSCNYVLIEDCTFNTGDDCIAIKSGKDTDGRRVGIPSQNIVVRNCIMKNGHGGVVCGSEMSGGIRNVYVEDCIMNSPDLGRALRIKTNNVRGGFIENINMRNVEVGVVSEAVLQINFFYTGGWTSVPPIQKISKSDIVGADGEFTPWVKHVNLENITSAESPFGILIEAMEESPVEGLVIKNCTFNNVAKGNVMKHVNDPRIINLVVNPDANPQP